MTKISIVHTGFFKLDGGAMFGVVPQTMWKKLNPPDENNLCTWAARCLLVEYREQKILIDTGIGEKQDERFRSHFAPHGSQSLESSIADLKLNPEDITDVILTHFHFDHVGGAAKRGKNGVIEPTFPNAKYWTNEIHYDWAYNTNPREAASFLKENFVPLKEQGYLHFIDVDQGIAFNDIIRLRFYYGHTEAMMVPFISLPSGKTLVFPADLVPSRHHIRLPYVMSYDIRPLATMRERQSFYDIVANDDYIICFEHDRDTAFAQIIKDERGRYGMNPYLESL